MTRRGWTTGAALALVVLAASTAWTHPDALRRAARAPADRLRAAYYGLVAHAYGR